MAQAWTTWPEDASVMCQWRAGGTEYPCRDGDTGIEDDSSFAGFFKLDKFAMFSFANDKRPGK